MKRTSNRMFEFQGFSFPVRMVQSLIRIQMGINKDRTLVEFPVSIRISA